MAAPPGHKLDGSGRPATAVRHRLRARRALGPATAVLATIALWGPVAPAGARVPADRTAGGARSAAGAHLRSVLSSAMGQMGATSGAYVYDLTSGQTLFADRATGRRSPASVEKLYTTSTALLRYGPDATLTTTVLGHGTQQPGGVFQGDLYLRGGGDPTFGSAAFVRRTYGTGATVQQLATALSSQGLTRVEGRVVGDESLFDHRRGEPSSGYQPDPFLTGQLSALAFDRGESAPAPSPAALAAQKLTEALRAAGITVTGSADSGRAPDGSLELARAASPPMRTLIKLTNVESDNFFAEMLVKDLGARFGGQGTTSAGAAVVRSQLAHFGLHPHIVDGSGLSPVDHTSPHDVVRLLTVMHGMPVGNDLRDSLAVAGRTGTLGTRMRGTAAAGNCHAKTGSLSDVSALAGYCTTAGGDQVAFAFLMNHVNVTTARMAQDRMAEAIASSP